MRTTPVGSVPAGTVCVILRVETLRDRTPVRASIDSLAVANHANPADSYPVAGLRSKVSAERSAFRSDRTPKKQMLISPVFDIVAGIMHFRFLALAAAGLLTLAQNTDCTEAI